MLAYLLCLRRISGSLSEQVDFHNLYYQLCNGSRIVFEEVDIRHNLYQFPKSKPWSTQDWPFQLSWQSWSIPIMLSIVTITSSRTTSPWWTLVWSPRSSLASWSRRGLLAGSGTPPYPGPWPWSGGDHHHHRNHRYYHFIQVKRWRSCDQWKKEVVKQLARFQSSLEKIDSYHHAVIPPFYRQVSMSVWED